MGGPVDFANYISWYSRSADLKVVGQSVDTNQWLWVSDKGFFSGSDSQLLKGFCRGGQEPFLFALTLDPDRPGSRQGRPVMFYGVSQTHGSGGIGVASRWYRHAARFRFSRPSGLIWFAVPAKCQIGRVKSNRSKTVFCCKIVNGFSHSGTVYRRLAD